MRVRIAVLLLALALPGCIFSVHEVSPPPAHPAAPGAYGLDVEIGPGQDAGTWSCRAVVTDLASGKAILEPRLLGKVGERAEVTSADGQATFTVSVLVEEGGRAGWTAEIVRQGRTVARQSGTVRL